MRTAIALFLILVAPAAAFAAGDDHAARALKAYHHAEYETALKEYEEAAKEKGGASVDMQIQMARCLDRLLRSNDAVIAYTRFLHGGAARPEAKEARERIAFLKKHLAQGATKETLAKQAIERGTTLYKWELYPESRAEFEAAVSELPDKPNGYRWLGLTQEHLGNCKAAITNFDTFSGMVASDDPRLEEITEARSRCSGKLAAEAAAAAPKPAPPARDEPAAPAANETDTKVKQHVDRGVELYSSGRYNEAREEFTIARSLAPEKATPFRWLGIVDAKLERCPEAIANLEVFLEKVKSDDPRVPEAKEILATCREKTNPSAAKPRPAAPKPAAPPPPETNEQKAAKLIEKGAQLYQQARYKEAREAFESARSLVPARANAYRWIGLVDARVGKCREAIASFDTFLSRVPNDDNRVPEVQEERDRCERDLTARPALAVAPRPAPAPAPTPYAPQPAPVAAAPAPTAAPAPSDQAPSRSGAMGLGLPIGVGVGALALVGIGAALTAVGNSQFNDLKKPVSEGGCAPNCTPDQVQPVRSTLYAGYAMFGLAGVAAVGDGVLWYLWYKQNKPAPRVMISPTTNGAMVSGTF